MTHRRYGSTPHARGNICSLLSLRSFPQISAYAVYAGREATGILWDFDTTPMHRSGRNFVCKEQTYGLWSDLGLLTAVVSPAAVGPYIGLLYSNGPPFGASVSFPHYFFSIRPLVICIRLVLNGKGCGNDIGYCH